jgi:hypothetical protein
MNTLPTIIETLPTPPMGSESPPPPSPPMEYYYSDGHPPVRHGRVVSFLLIRLHPTHPSWLLTYLPYPRLTPQVTATLQAIAHRARDRHAARIVEAEFAQFAQQQQQQQTSESEPAAAAALDQLRDTVFAQLRSQLAAAAAASSASSAATAPTPTPQFVAGLVRALERERAARAKLTRRVAVLERERDEATRRAAEHEATIEALGRPRIPLSRSTSSVSTSSESHSDRVVSSSNRGSPPTSVFDALRKTTTMATTTTTTAMTTTSASTSTLLIPIPTPIRSSSLAPGRPLGNHNSNKSNGNGNCNINGNMKSNGNNGGTNVVSRECGYLSFTIPKTTSGTSGTGSSIDLDARL